MVDGVEALLLFVIVEVLVMVAGVIAHVAIAHEEGGHHLGNVAYHLDIVVFEATVDHHHIVVFAVPHLMLLESDADQ